MIDIHSHSTYSDDSFSVEKLLNEAEKKFKFTFNN